MVTWTGDVPVFRMQCFLRAGKHVQKLRTRTGWGRVLFHAHPNIRYEVECLGLGRGQAGH